MEDATCCHNSYAYFPYRRVIRASKYYILPLRDSEGKLCGIPDPDLIENNQQVSSPAAKTDIATRHSNTQPIASKPPTCNDDLEPLSAPVQRAIRPTVLDRCAGIVTPLQRLTTPVDNTLRDHLRARVKDMEQQALKMPERTPMSPFRNDNRYLNRAIRYYKRSVELEKSRGLYYEPPKEFSDEKTRRWYRDMVEAGRPCLEEDTHELLLQTDCIKFKDGAGGFCFHCPDRKLPPIVGADNKPQSTAVSFGSVWPPRHDLCDC